MGLEKDVRQPQLSVPGCKVITIKTISTAGAGQLSFFEGQHDIPFDMRRIYYISQVPDGVRRGFHAHKELKQLIFCPYGNIRLFLDDGRGNKDKIELSDPSVGVVVERPVWREMLWCKEDSVLCVAASDYYSEADYIRNYDDFLAYLQENG